MGLRKDMPAHTRPPASLSGASHAPAPGMGKGNVLFQSRVEILMGAVEMGCRKETQSRGWFVCSR